MTWSTIAVTAGDIALRADGKPMLGVTNAASLPAIWTAGGGSDGFDGTDITDDPIYPLENAFEGHGHKTTRPTDATNNTYYLCFTVGAPFDLMVALGHNLYQLGATTGDLQGLSLSLEVDATNDPTFANPVTLRSILNWSSLKRLVFLSLNDDLSGNPSSAPLSYVGVLYARLAIARMDGNPFETMPEIGEIFLGSRLQLSRGSDEEFAEDSLESHVEDSESKTGEIIRYEWFRNRAIVSPHWEHDVAADFSYFRGLYTASVGPSGTSAPFFWIPRPDLADAGSGASAGIGKALWVLPPSSYMAPTVEVITKRFAMELKELRPFYANE